MVRFSYYRDNHHSFNLMQRHRRYILPAIHANMAQMESERIALNAAIAEAALKAVDDLREAQQRTIEQTKASNLALSQPPVPSEFDPVNEEAPPPEEPEVKEGQ